MKWYIGLGPPELKISSKEQSDTSQYELRYPFDAKFARITHRLCGNNFYRPIYSLEIQDICHLITRKQPSANLMYLTSPIPE